MSEQSCIGQSIGVELGGPKLALTACVLKSPLYEEPYFPKLEAVLRSVGIPMLVSEEQLDDFAELRNSLATVAPTDWVLMLDADELMLAEDLANLKRMAECPSAFASPYGWKFNKDDMVAFRRYNYWGDPKLHEHRVDGDWYPDLQLRMYDKTRYEWVGKLHEHLLPRKGTYGVAMWRHEAHIHHLGWLRPREVLKVKEDRYDDMMGQKRPLRLTVEEIPELKLAWVPRSVL